MEGDNMLSFNVPPYIGKEVEYIQEAIAAQKICGDGQFTKKISIWMEEKFKSPKVLLTTSCTSALEMAAILCDIQQGDEVIMPSYTFVSTANAFVLRGAKIVFVDIRPDTMNIDENLIEAAITTKTKVIVPVHYAGVSCEMDRINEIAKKYGLFVVEDAAQGVMSTYNGQALGTLGDFGCYSFHETKNYSMGEGGALLIRDAEKYAEKAEIIREKGTNRSKFYRGQIDKYSWVDIGASYLPSELNAAYLWAQLECADVINNNRLKSWHIYHEGLADLEEKGFIERPNIPSNCIHNAHMYYIKAKNLKERTSLMEYLKYNEILTVFHYVPLHSSEAGLKFSRFYGEDKYTTKESERLIRLPLYYSINQDDVERTIDMIKKYYRVFGYKKD